MKVYVCMIDDRRGGPDVTVFTSAAAAITYARNSALSAALRRGDYSESRPGGGELFYATYSVEGDSVWVVEREVHE